MIKSVFIGFSLSIALLLGAPALAEEQCTVSADAFLKDECAIEYPSDDAMKSVCYIGAIALSSYCQLNEDSTCDKGQAYVQNTFCTQAFEVANEAYFSICQSSTEKAAKNPKYCQDSDSVE